MLNTLASKLSCSSILYKAYIGEPIAMKEIGKRNIKRCAHQTFISMSLFVFLSSIFTKTLVQNYRAVS